MCIWNLKLVIFITFCKVLQVCLVELDVIDCGIDHEIDVSEGNVEISQYPWLGILYYTFYGDSGEARAVTTVALIQAEFVIAPAADIGPMPKNDFRANTIVLLGEDWHRRGRRVRNYVLHPEYGETYNTVALVQLSTPVRSEKLRPLCPPPDRLRNPDFYVVKFKEGDDYNLLQKQVVPVTHVMSSLCKEFYIRANLGLGVRGPGCGAPSRYLDMMSYYPWVEDSLDKFRRISISKISKQKYILRGGSHAYQRFGNCDEEEKINLIYREMIVLRTDNNQYQFLTYNMSVYDNVEFSCLTLELVNASAVSEMRIKHICTRESKGPPCYSYKGSVFEISVYLMFSDTCRFEMFAWGWKKNMTLIDIHQWKWEEGTYYEDFTMQPVEYRGPTHETQFGFEPLDRQLWLPDYDVWSTSQPPDPSLTTTTRRRLGEDEAPPPLEETKATGDEKKIRIIDRSTQPPDIKTIEFMTGKPNPLDRYTQKWTTPPTE